jgi:hypothetical protein
MTECPECGTEVPADGNFCPECGTRMADGHGGRVEAHPSGTHQTSQTSDSEEDWKYPVDGSTATAPQFGDHNLLLAGVVGLSVIGLIEGIAQIVWADTLVEIAEQEFGLGEEFAAEQLVIAGGFSVVIALAVVAATAYFYWEGSLQKLYFWALIGSGVAGFLLAQSLFLAALVAFGIYGLVSVID